MGRRYQARGFATLIFVFLLICRAFKEPTPRENFKIAAPSCSGPNQKNLIRDAGKSCSAHSAAAKKIGDGKVVTQASRKAATISEADMVSAQKKVERLAGRNDMLKKKLEASREEVKSHQEKSKTFINELKTKISTNKQKVNDTQEEIETLEERQKNLEEELNIRKVELSEKNTQYEKEEGEIKKKCEVEKNMMVTICKTIFRIYRATQELAKLMIDKVRKGTSAEVIVNLDMPRFAARSSTIVLHCNYNVPPDQLYKVEWRRAGVKLVQYVRGRKPPFRFYPTTGAQHDVTKATDRSIVLQHLEFSASDTYSCEVCLETPIFTKSSLEKDLQVIQPQRHVPRIIFGARVYSTGDVLEATCSTSPAFPAPYITWLVNGEKVDVSQVRSEFIAVPIKRHPQWSFRRTISRYPNNVTSTRSPIFNNKLLHPTTNSLSTDQPKKTKSCSSKDVHDDPIQLRNPPKRPSLQVDESLTIPIVSSHRRIGGDTLMSSTTRLSVAVSSLKLAAGGRLELTCLATIPAYKGPLGKYADSRNHSVLVDIVVEEEPEQSTTPEMLRSSNTAPGQAMSLWILLLYCVISQYYYYDIFLVCFIAFRQLETFI